MSEIKEFVETVTRAFTLSRRTTHKERSACVICYNDDGTIRELNISSSLITRFYHNGNKKEFCPLKMYVTVINKKFTVPPTESMMRGLLLESLLIGETAQGKENIQLPRHKVSGAKLAVEKAIEKQASMWPMRCEHHGIIVHKDGPYKNVQVRQKIGWNSHEYPEIDINIYATADLITPIKDNGFEYDMAVTDIKGTADVNSNFGEYAWGDEGLKYKDHFQLVLYNRVYDLPVAYIVFDWSKNLGFKIIPVNINPNHPEQEKAAEARFRIKQMEETIRKTIIDIMSFEKSGWNAEPGTDCLKCPNIYCEHNGKTQEI